MDIVYLDNAATTFPKPDEVREEIRRCLDDLPLTPGRGTNALVNTASSMWKRPVLPLRRTAGFSRIASSFVPSPLTRSITFFSGFPFREGDTLTYLPYEHNAVWRCAYI